MNPDKYPAKVAGFRPLIRALCPLTVVKLLGRFNLRDWPEHAPRSPRLNNLQLFHKSSGIASMIA